METGCIIIAVHMFIAAVTIICYWCRYCYCYYYSAHAGRGRDLITNNNDDNDNDINDMTFYNDNVSLRTCLVPLYQFPCSVFVNNFVCV